MFTLIYGYIAFTAVASVAITVMGINAERRASALAKHSNALHDVLKKAA
ncbi:MAG: hypothetical protein HZA24_03300 [Nitrospirae bacterium]|nr:hypothetical protein [Nitrospirota bacterium]